MFLSPVQLLYSDLMFPSHNDGWYGTTLLDQVGLYEIVALRTGNPQLKEILAACYKKVKRTSPEALINGMDLDSCGDKVVCKIIYSQIWELVFCVVEIKQLF